MTHRKPHTILFQGDSITDMHRDRDEALVNRATALGTGYANLLASRLLFQEPERNWAFPNRGVSGDRLADVARRWQKDCLELEPDFVSLLIGVNDTWHFMSNPADGGLESFVAQCKALLELTKRRHPIAILDVLRKYQLSTSTGDILRRNLDFCKRSIIFCEPFIITPLVDDVWQANISARQAAIKGIAAQFYTSFIVFYAAFDAAPERAPKTC